MLNSRVFWKIYLSFIFFIVLTISSVGMFMTYEIENDELRQIEQRLITYASLLKDTTSEQLETSSPILQRQVAALHGKLGVRLTIIKLDGKVVSDSDEEPSKMDNHASRPEIVEARGKGVGVATRFSNTVRENMMYVALPIKSGDSVIGYSRAAFLLIEINQKLAKIRSIGFAAIGVGALFALLAGWFLARQIVFPLTTMTELANSISEGSYNQRIPIKSKDEFGSLARALNTMSARITQDIAEREVAEEKIQTAHDELERRVEERTVELSQTNAQLIEQIAERKRTDTKLEESQ